MWFTMPSGAENITIERQSFQVEIRGKNGQGYFRAPNALAPKLLAIPGFTLANDLPEDAPEDLPPTNLAQDSAVATLAASLEAQIMEIEGLRSDLVAAKAELAAAQGREAALNAKLEAALDEIENLQDKIEDNGIGQAPATAPLSSKASPALKGRT